MNGSKKHTLLLNRGKKHEKVYEEHGLQNQYYIR